MSGGLPRQTPTSQPGLWLQRLCSQTDSPIPSAVGMGAVRGLAGAAECATFDHARCATHRETIFTRTSEIMCCTPPQPVLSPPALHVHHVRPVGGALWAWWAPVYSKGAPSGPTGSTAVFFYTVDNIDNNNGKASDRGQEAPSVRDFRGSAVECLRPPYRRASRLL